MTQNEEPADPRHRVFAAEYVASGGRNLVGAARTAGLVPPGRGKAADWKEAVRVLREEGVQTYVLQCMEDVGLSIHDALAALGEALGAYRYELDYKSGAVVNLGPDHKVRADAGDKILRAALGIGYNHKDEGSKFGKTRVEVVYPAAPLNGDHPGNHSPQVIVIEGQTD